MKKSTKGAVAAGLGAVLLIGGGNTLASWSSTTSPDGGGAITSGHLNLITDDVNLGCGDWSLEHVLDYQIGDPLVPGDVLSLDCAFTIQALGANLEATVAVDTPTFSGDDAEAFADDLTVDVTSLQVDGQQAGTLTSADDGDTVNATIEVSFDELAGNATMDLEAALDGLTLTATQVVP